MRILTTLPQDDLAQVPAAARAAEAAGYDGVVTSENKNDPFLALGVAAVSTERLALHTGIAIAFSRSPMPVANTSWDLQVASRGRFVLGLGSQVRAHNEKRFSVPWTAPAPRLREYVQALRAIWRCWERGEKLDHRGEHYTFTLMTPNFTPRSAGQPMVPVTIAAVGPAMLRVAGEVCDGVRLHGFCTRRYLDEVVMRELRTGMAKGGRSRERFEIAGGGFIATGPDDAAVAKMVEWVRYRVAFYASTPAYWPVLEVHGLQELGRKLNVMSKAGQWDRMAAEISDDVVRLFAAIGTHRELARAIAERFGGVADSVTLSGGYGVHQEIPPDLVQDIRKIPSSFTGYHTEGPMGAKSEALAKEYEAKVQEATAVLEKLSDADWKKTTSAEKWTVGVVAHHVAGGHEGIAGLLKTVAAGQSIPGFTMDMLDAMNAKHAQDFANVTKAETLDLHKKNAAAAAALVRGLSDADLANSGTLLQGMPAMSAEQVIKNILINHVDEHYASINATV